MFINTFGKDNFLTFESLANDLSYPIKVIYGADLTVRPIDSYIGNYKESGEILRMYLEMIFKKEDLIFPSDISNESIYLTAKDLDESQSFKDANYISLISGMQTIFNLYEIHGIKNTRQILWFKNFPNGIKRIVHREGFALLETAFALPLCGENCGTQFKFDAHNITLKTIDNNISKVFIACGYDEKYVLVINSLSIKYGSRGYALIDWNILKQIFIKCGALARI